MPCNETPAQECFTEKKCKTCKQSKPLLAYGFMKSSPDGRMIICKSCFNEEKYSRIRSLKRDQKMGKDRKKLDDLLYEKKLKKELDEL